jgi:hypothetical protein
MSIQLTQGERLSSTWQKVYEHLEEELHSAQLKLERLLSADETNMTRGEIRAIRRLMSLNTERPFIE